MNHEDLKQSSDYEHHYEDFMNTFMNTLQRSMNTMNTFNLITLFLLIKKGVVYNIHNKKCVSIISESLHSIHLLKKSIHKSVCQVFLQIFMFGGFKRSYMGVF
jgi:hypothetical protein